MCLYLLGLQVRLQFSCFISRQILKNSWMDEDLQVASSVVFEIELISDMCMCVCRCMCVCAYLHWFLYMCMYRYKYYLGLISHVSSKQCNLWFCSELFWLIILFCVCSECKRLKVGLLLIRSIQFPRIWFMYIGVLDYLKLFIWEMLHWKLAAKTERVKVILILKEKCGNHLSCIDKNLSIDTDGDKTQCKIINSSESNCISAADGFCRDRHATNISSLT